LNYKWVVGVVLEDRVIELGDLLAARSVPKLEDRRNESNARHFVCKAVFGKKIECGGMSRGGPRIRLRAFVDVKQPDRETLAPEQQRGQQADRAASRYQYTPLLKTHIRKLCSQALATCTSLGHRSTRLACGEFSSASVGHERS
jgi:hypothetical protein